MASVFVVLTTVAILVFYNQKVSKILSHNYQKLLDLSAGGDDDAVRLRLEHVFIEGQVNLKADTLIDMLNVNIGEPILGINIHQIRSRIEQSVWVDSVSIERQIPNALHVRVVEREPIALWQNQGNISLIDTEGRVIEGVDLKKFKDLFLIVGKDAPQHINNLVPLVQSDKKIKSKIKSAIRVGNRRWNIRFSNGIEVMLPEENTSAAWNTLLDLHRKKSILSSKELSVIDLRLADRITMQKKDENRLRNSGV